MKIRDIKTISLVLFMLMTIPSLAQIMQKNKLDTIYLKLKWKHQFQFAGYYAAVEKGYYKDVGLHVILQEPEEGEESVHSVLHGESQYGVASSDLLLLRNTGFHVVLLANIFQHSPYVFLSIKSDNADNIHDLAGKSLMLEEHAAELKAYLKLEQIQLEGMDIIPHSFSPKDLLDSTIFAMSAYATDEPFLLVKEGVEFNTFNPRSSGIDFYGDVLYTSEDEIQNHPDRTKAFLDASLKGWEYALSNEDEIVDLIYSKYSQRHSKEHLKFEAEQTQRLIMSDVIEIGYINPNRWRRIGEIYAELDMLPEDFSLEGFIYDRNPKSDIKNTIIMFSMIVLIALLLFIIAYRYYRLNRNLKSEIIENTKKEEQLILLEERYRSLAENAPFPIMIATPDSGKILYMNPSACEMFEITKDYAHHKSVLDFYVEPDKRKVLIDKITKHGFVKNTEFEMKTAGNRKFGALISSNIINFDNQPALFSGIQDISERLLLEKEIKKANLDKDKIFSIIAHDLKGPIGTLDGLLGMMIKESNPFSKEDKQDILERLKKSSKATYELLDNLLMWSLTQQGKTTFNPQATNVSDIITNNLELFAEAFHKKNIQVNANCESNLNFSLDSDMINLVVRNLLNNAIKYSHIGGHIRLNAELKDEHLEIIIQDTGCGMEKDTLDTLFKIDNTKVSKKGTKGEGGSGLGLMLCSDFVAKHHGTIQVESNVNEGSKFTIKLPKQHQ